MSALSTISGPKLRKLIEKLSAEASEATQAAISNGLGNVRFNEMRELAASGDSIACRVVETWGAESDARRELAERQKWHGSDAPIRRAA